MADAIMRAGITDWATAINTLCTPPLDGLQYHKHITTHVLDGDDLTWTCKEPGMRHVFLIREPERVAASFNLLLPNAETNTQSKVDELEQYIGFHQQYRLFNHIKEHSSVAPLVIDSSRFLTDPERHLQRLCSALDIPFESSMLSWPAGERISDGVWASHWYASVHRSTGFGPSPRGLPELNDVQAAVAMRCRPVYDELLAHTN